MPACLETSSQLLVRLRCTVPTPGSGKRRALHSDLKSRQPAAWEEGDHQTTFNLRILILSLSKLHKAANWMQTATSAQSGGLIGIFPRSSAEKCFARYRDPQPEDLVMYLHALRYTVSNVQASNRDKPWTKSSSRVILGHSEPPSPLGQNQAGLDENYSLQICVSSSKFMNCPNVFVSSRAGFKSLCRNL